MLMTKTHGQAMKKAKNASAGPNSRTDRPLKLIHYRSSQVIYRRSTSHRHARSGKPRTQQGKRDPRKCNASSVTFSPGPPTHLHTYTPLAFKHAAEKQISNAHFKREFTFILTHSLFYGMDLVAPGRTFSCQGRGKVPRGSATTCAKRACCIYLLNTNKR